MKKIYHTEDYNPCRHPEEVAAKKVCRHETNPEFVPTVLSHDHHHSEKPEIIYQDRVVYRDRYSPPPYVDELLKRSFIKGFFVGVGCTVLVAIAMEFLWRFL